MPVERRSSRAVPPAARATRPGHASAASAGLVSTRLRRRLLRRPLSRPSRRTSRSGGSSPSSLRGPASAHQLVGVARRRGGARAPLSLLRHLPAAGGALRRHGGEVHRRCGDGGVGNADRHRGRRRTGRPGRARTRRRRQGAGEEVGAPELRARAGVLTGEAAVNLGATARGWSPGTRGTLGVAGAVGRRARNGVRRRGNPARERAPQSSYEDGGLVRRSRGRRSECRCGARCASSAGVGGGQRAAGPRGAVRRARPGAAQDQGDLPRDAPRGGRSCCS